MPPAVSRRSPESPLRKHFWYYVYNFCWILCWPLLALYYSLRARTDGKYRATFRFRLGLDTPAFLSTPPRVWFHALSVGETLSVVPLVEALQGRKTRSSHRFFHCDRDGTENGTLTSGIYSGGLSSPCPMIFHGACGT